MSEDQEPEVEVGWAIRVRQVKDWPWMFSASWYGPLPASMKDMEGREIMGSTPLEAVSELLKVLQSRIDLDAAGSMVAALRPPSTWPEGTVSASEERGGVKTVHTMSRELFEGFLVDARAQGWVE